MTRFTVRTLTATALLASCLTTAAFAGHTSLTDALDLATSAAAMKAPAALDFTQQTTAAATAAKPVVTKGLFAMMRRNPGKTVAVVAGVYFAGWYLYNHPEAVLSLKDKIQPIIDAAMPHFETAKAYATHGWNMLPVEATDFMGQATGFIQTHAAQGYSLLAQSYDTLNVAYSNAGEVVSLARNGNLPQLLKLAQSASQQLASAKEYFTTQKDSLVSSASSLYAQTSDSYAQLPSTSSFMSQAGEFLAAKIAHMTQLSEPLATEAEISSTSTGTNDATTLASVLSVVKNIQEAASGLPSWNETASCIGNFFNWTK